MKVTKIIFGSLCLCLSMLSIFQSCAAGLYNTLASTGRFDGFIGLIVTFCMIVGGMVLLFTRTNHSGTVPATVIFLFASYLGQSNKSFFGDLGFYGVVMSFFALTLSIFAVKEHNDDGKDTDFCWMFFALSLISFLLIFAK